jgi:mRNA interferase HicA
MRLLREGANHSFWGVDAERSTAVPRQREISYPLARKICKDLGIPPPTRARRELTDITCPQSCPELSNSDPLQLH